MVNKWTMLPPIDRIMQRIVVCNNGCWEWQQSSFGTDRYGRFSFNGKLELAHRAVYMILCGPISDGLVLDHRCEYKRCVNPDHLEPVTQKVNVDRYHGVDTPCRVCGGKRKRNGMGKLYCRPCANRRSAAYRNRRN